MLLLAAQSLFRKIRAVPCIWLIKKGRQTAVAELNVVGAFLSLRERGFHCSCTRVESSLMYFMLIFRDQGPATVCLEVFHL